MNGGAWGQSNRSTVPEMQNWSPLVQYRGFLWTPTHVGGGPAELFEVELAAPWARISAGAVSQTARLETLGKPGSATPFKGYFMEFGGHLVPVNSWTAVRFDEFSKHLRLETSGTIGGDSLRQLDITMDLRDNLAQFLVRK